MRYGIFSDIHSNLEAIEAVIEAYKKESIDSYLSIGDVVGYASSPKECIDKLKTLANFSVAGNHDWASVDLFPLNYFNPVAADALLWTKQELDDKSRYYLESLKLIYQNEDLTLVHGSLDNPQDFNYMTDSFTAAETFKLLETNICFVGHTHVAGIFVNDAQGDIYYTQEHSIDIEERKKYIVNVGSVGQPRDSNPAAAYCIYDTQEKKVSIKRISYDRQKTRNKIIAAGLPHFLGDRLLVAR